MESHDSTDDSSSGYDSSAICKTTGRRTRRGGYGARYGVASACREVLIWSGADEFGQTPEVGQTNRPPGALLLQSQTATRLPIPSLSAAIRVPSTRLVIFWNATSRA